jgi:uncharacterized metal-binding protein YceD (DUF177 family)
MANPLLERVLPAELAERCQVIEFEGKVGDFDRLKSIVSADLEAIDERARPRGWARNPVSVRLEFRWLDADRRLPAAAGSVSTRLRAVCQRCLEPFEMPVDIEFSILFATAASGDAVIDAPGFETWELDGDAVRLLDVVEESLVMALPLAPVHGSADDCGPLAGRIADRAAQSVRPFADLRARLEKAEK